MLIFVYGTLKRGEVNHFYLSGQRFVTDVRTRPCFRIYDLGGYPGLVAVESGGLSIQGEVWQVDAACLLRLDLLEDVAGGEYAREPVLLLPPHADWLVQGYRYLWPIPPGTADLGVSW
jgi:gamma-glutamylaminecyclotransferase